SILAASPSGFSLHQLVHCGNQIRVAVETCAIPPFRILTKRVLLHSGNGGNQVYAGTAVLRFTIQNAAIPPCPAWPVLPNVESKLTNMLSQYREPRGGPGGDARILRFPARRRSPGCAL